MSQLTKEEYTEFMYNKKNIHNCERCPENNKDKDKLPCGQYNCWVSIHCFGEPAK